MGMNEGQTDFELAQGLLRGVSFSALTEGRRGIIIAAVRVVPDPGARPLEKLEELSVERDASVRTRLVFDNDGALVPDECIINRKIAKEDES